MIIGLSITFIYAAVAFILFCKFQKEEPMLLQVNIVTAALWFIIIPIVIVQKIIRRIKK